MEETNVHLLTRISDYLRARVWLQDYTIARKGFNGAQTSLMDTDDPASHEIFCSRINSERRLEQMTYQALSSPSPDTHEVCTWWHAYSFDNPIRKLVHNPRKVLGAYIEDGMTVMDVGCGMGHFSIGMAKLIGKRGKVIAVDLQQKMLDVMLKRARRAGVADRIISHRCEADNIGEAKTVDFILAFWMVHEVPDHKNFFNQLKSALAPGGKILIAEPRFHIKAEELDQSIETAEACGLRCIGKPDIRFSLTALLEAA